MTLIKIISAVQTMINGSLQNAWTTPSPTHNTHLRE